MICPSGQSADMHDRFVMRLQQCRLVRGVQQDPRLAAPSTLLSIDRLIAKTLRSPTYRRFSNISERICRLRRETATCLIVTGMFLQAFPFEHARAACLARFLRSDE
jgi:hypothetical protein